MPSMSVTRLAEAPRYFWKDDVDMYSLWTWMLSFPTKPCKNRNNSYTQSSQPNLIRVI